MPAAGPAVLCVGYSDETQNPRCDLLRKAGYEVHAARSREEAREQLRKRAFPAVVIGHSVPEEHRHEYIDAARKLNSDAIVVLLYWDSIRRAEKADAILCIGNGPMALVHALRDLLGR